VAPQKGPDDRTPKSWGVARYALNLGFFVALSIVIGFFAGFWLDRLLGTSPLFSIALMLLAVAGSFYKVYRDIMKMY